MNSNGGGIYALEWDPENHYIKSWVFSPDIPQNLQDAIDTAGSEDASERVMPDPHSWGLPYAYFAIGDTTGCSADHFKNMRIVFNLAFCGNVAGNRFTGECSDLAKKFNVTNDHGNHDPVLTCNAYIESNPEALEEAFWKIKVRVSLILFCEYFKSILGTTSQSCELNLQGVYVYERELEKPKKEKQEKS